MNRLSLLFIGFLAVLACYAEDDRQTAFLEKYDLSLSIIRPDSVPTNDTYSWWTDSVKQRWLDQGQSPKQDRWNSLPEPLGYRGDNYQRFEIHFDTVYQSSPSEYTIRGKIRCHDSIFAAQGHIIIDSVVPLTNPPYDLTEYFNVTEFGSIYAHYSLSAYQCPIAVARLFGSSQYYYLIHNDSIFYDKLESVADGYCNNQYTGFWVYLDSHDTLTCNWGDFRIPQSLGFDIGAGDFSPAHAYRVNGWENYSYNANSGWWRDSIDCETYSDSWIQPEFPGGQEALFKWLKDNLHYPVTTEPFYAGKTVVQFLVHKDGTLSDFEVVRSSGYDLLDDTAIRCLSTMPDWTPGTLNGEPIAMRYFIPITFRLQ